MPRKKGDDHQPWLNPNLHVWRNKVGELTVINLRNADIDLGPVVEPAAATSKAPTVTEKKPAQAPVTEARERKSEPASVTADPCIVTAVKSAAAPEPSKSETDSVKTLLRQFMAKNEQSKRQPSQPSSLTTSATNPLAYLQNAATSATTHVTPKPDTENRSRVGRSPPAAATGAPTAPTTASSKELLSGSASKPMAFEFVSGTNIPGRGMVINNTSPPAPPVESPPPPPPGHSVALFHDPLWGGVDSSLLLSATTATTPSPVVDTQTTVTAPAPPAFNFDFLQASQGLLGMNSAVPMAGHVPVSASAASAAAFRALPAGYPATAAPPVTTATMPQASGLSGVPMTYIQAQNTTTMMPVHYFYSSDASLHAHQPVMLQNAAHAVPHQQPHMPQVVRATGVQSSSPASASNTGVGAAGLTRAGINVEAPPFVPSGRS